MRFGVLLLITTMVSVWDLNQTMPINQSCRPGSSQRFRKRISSLLQQPPLIDYVVPLYSLRSLQVQLLRLKSQLLGWWSDFRTKWERMRDASHQSKLSSYFSAWAVIKNSNRVEWCANLTSAAIDNLQPTVVHSRHQLALPPARCANAESERSKHRTKSESQLWLPTCLKARQVPLQLLAQSKLTRLLLP